MPDKKGNLRYDEGQIRQVRRYLKKGLCMFAKLSLGVSFLGILVFEACVVDVSGFAEIL